MHSSMAGSSTSPRGPWTTYTSFAPVSSHVDHRAQVLAVVGVDRQPDRLEQVEFVLVKWNGVVQTGS